jgi:hypothetical protein
VQSDQVWVLPWWLVVGVLVGLLIGMLIAAVFVVGSRLFPDTPREPTAGGENRKRTEIRRYLRAINETFIENYELAGSPVDFYLPERDVAITFDARVFFRIEGSDTYGVLVEHEMPGIHLGRRLPFETPDLTAGPDTDEKTMTAFAVLGLPTDANQPEIKSAYREKVKYAHPDRGGNKEAFNQVREAYATASAHAANTESSAVPASATS